MYGQQYWLRTMFMHLFLQIFSPDLLCLGPKPHCVSSCNIHRAEGNPQVAVWQKSKNRWIHMDKDEQRVRWCCSLWSFSSILDLWTNYRVVKNLMCVFASFYSNQQRRGLRLDFGEGKKTTLFSVITVFFRALHRWRRNRKKQEYISYKIHTRTPTNFKWIKEFIWS